MATIQGNIVSLVLATAAPAVVLTGYLYQWNPVIHASITTKTIWAMMYFFVAYHTFYKYFTWKLRHIPTSQDPSYLLGHGLVVLDKPRGSTFLKWMKQVPNDGLLSFRGFLHMGANLVVTTPEAAMDVLNTRAYDFEKPPPARRFLARVLGNGLVNVEGNEHKFQRKNVTPAFSGKTIKGLVPLFWSKGVSLANTVKQGAAANDNTIEVGSFTHKATLDIIGSAGLGKDFATTENTENAELELAEQYSTITDPRKGSVALYFFINMIFPQWFVRILPLKANKRVAHAVVQLRRIVKKLLAEKAQLMEEKTVEQKDIIAMLMRSGNFTDEGLTDQLLTFLAAGHETTASALVWAVYLLCQTPDVQTRLRNECRQVAGHLDPSEITADVVDSIYFLDAVCSEVLRVYPTVPMTSRRTVRQTRIGEQVIPEGTYVLIPIWAFNHLPSLWGKDADEFRPDRWLDAEGKPTSETKHGGATSPYAFITFLYGPRSCIGQNFARYEMKCLLATLVMRFEFKMKRPDEVIVPEGAVTIKPKNGLEVIVKEV